MKTKTILIAMTVFCILALRVSDGFAVTATTDQTTTATSTPTTSLSSSTTSTTSTGSTSTTQTSSGFYASALSPSEPSSLTPEQDAIDLVLLKEFSGQLPSTLKKPVATVVDGGIKVSIFSVARHDPDNDPNTANSIASYSYVYLVKESSLSGDLYIQSEKYYSKGKLSGEKQWDEIGNLTMTMERGYDSNGQIKMQQINLYKDGELSKQTWSRYVNGKLESIDTFYYEGNVLTTLIRAGYSAGVKQHSTTTYVNASNVATKEVYSKYFSSGKVAERIITEYSTTLTTDSDGRKYYPALVQYRSVYDEKNGTRREYSVARFNAQGYRKSFSGYWFSETGAKTGSFSAGYSVDGKSMLSWISRLYHPGTTVTQFYDKDDHAARKHYHIEYDKDGNRIGATTTEASGPVDVAHLRVIRPV